MRKISRAFSKLSATVLMLLAVAATLAVAVAVQTYIFPQKANVAGSVQVTFTLNGTSWTNGTQWDWGVVQPGIWNNVSLNVYNGGNTNDSLALLPITFPSGGWDETWTLDGMHITVSQTLIGILQLYVPATYPPGSISGLSSLQIAVNQV